MTKRTPRMSKSAILASVTAIACTAVQLDTDDFKMAPTVRKYPLPFGFGLAQLESAVSLETE